MPSLSRVQPCGSRFERFLDTCLSAATRLWAIPCRFSPPLSAPSDSPATWPLLRRAPVGCHGSPGRVLAKNLRRGTSLHGTRVSIRSPEQVWRASKSLPAHRWTPHHEPHQEHPAAGRRLWLLSQNRDGCKERWHSATPRLHR